MTREKRRKRELGFWLWLASNGEVRVAEKNPETGNNWLGFCDHEHPLTKAAAEELQERLCISGGAPNQVIYVFDHENLRHMDQLTIMREFDKEFKDQLQAMTQELWSPEDGKWNV